MARLLVRIGEGDDRQPTLIWDSVWYPADGFADWVLAGADEPQNRGGLQSRAALHSAVILSLFTDRRIPDEHPLRKFVSDADPRGWFGDGVDVRADLHEVEMGSLLWVFERATLTEEVRLWVEAVALESLAPLIQQGAAVRIDVKADAKPEFNRCNLFVEIYGRDGSRLYDYRFEDIWRQTASAPAPQPFAVQSEF